MEKLILRKPTKNDKIEVLKFKQELLNFDSEFAGEGGLVKNDMFFEDWLEKIELYSNLDTLPKDRVLGSQFLTIRESDNKIVGMVNVRYYLNDSLKLRGGHIGDVIRPSERNKGYGTAQIALAIEHLKKNNVGNILITCKKENIASAKTIQKNGGILENELDIDGEIFKRYWIK